MAFAAAVAILVSVPAASAAPAATLQATKGCWLDVINDWLDNNKVDKIYAIPCYAQAIQQLNKYPDVQNYSSAAEDIRRAELAAIHDRGQGGSNGPGGGGQGGGVTGGGTKGGGGGKGGSQPPIASIFNKGKPANARSVPLPLIVLGAIAVLLLLSAAGTWFVRRLQARRLTPAPATAPVIDDRR